MRLTVVMIFIFHYVRLTLLIVTIFSYVQQNYLDLSFNHVPFPKGYLIGT